MGTDIHGCATPPAPRCLTAPHVSVPASTSPPLLWEGDFFVMCVRLRMDGLPFGAVRPWMAASTHITKKISLQQKARHAWRSPMNRK
jgi:hypothetical protein